MDMSGSKRKKRECGLINRRGLKEVFFPHFYTLPLNYFYYQNTEHKRYFTFVCGKPSGWNAIENEGLNLEKNLNFGSKLKQSL